MKFLALLVSFLAFFAPDVAAQSTRTAPVASPRPPGRATLNLATGEIMRDNATRSVGLVTIWANTDYSGFYSTPFQPGEEWLSWGTITTTSGSDVIGAFHFGYGTSILDTTVGGPGASLCQKARLRGRWTFQVKSQIP